MTDPTTENQPTALRTHLCGVLRPADVGQTVHRLRLGGPPARARRAPRLRGPARPHRHHPVRHRPRHRRALRVGHRRHRHRPPPARGHGQPRHRHGRGGDRGLHRRGPQRGRAAAVLRRRPRRVRRAGPPASTATSTCAGRVCSATCACGPGSTPPSGPPWTARASPRSRRRCSGRPTPEGSREFSVPSRLHHGEFYALPQSPQLAKQLLMVGGFDRYFQIARCLRDEDLRADRQFEFMQLDMECSFASQDDVMAFVSEAVLDAAEAATGERPPPIERMTWAEARDRYGTDKPDLRFGLELIDLSEVFEGTEVKAFSSPTVKAHRRARRRDLAPQAARRADRAGQESTAPPAWPGSASSTARTAPRSTDPWPATSRSRRRRASCEQTKAEPGDLILAVSDELRDGLRGAGRAARGDRRRRRWRRARIDTCGSSTSPCSRASGPTATRSRRTIRSPCRTPRTCRCWRPTRSPCARRPTTSCSTGGSWARGASVSTAGDMQEQVFAALGHRRPRRPRPASASCWAPSATGRRRTPGSPSGSTGWWRSWPARRTSARSSRTRRRSPGPTC